MKNIIKILAIAIILIFIVTPILLQPKGIITAKEIEFKWLSISKNNLLIVDDNQKFSSPELFIQTNNKSYKTYLPPNKYYWKVRAIYNNFYIESIPSSFTLNSITALSINKTSVRNDGNTAVNVTTISRSKITGSAVLEMNEQIPAKDSTYFEAQQT